MPKPILLLCSVFVLLVWSRTALATTKDECLEAHGRGQEQRDKGTLSKARQSFTTCAQSTCPALVQADCARSSEELAQMLPSVTFVARDANGADLPATSVYVDEVLFTTHLDDGRSHDVDPGKHVVRYVHDGREASIRVVLNQGEKGRVLVATFTAGTQSAPHSTDDAFQPEIEERRSRFPLGVAGIGVAAVVTGAVIIGIGMSRVPDACSMSTRECTGVAKNDPILGEARSATALANTGVGIGIAGAAFLVGGLVWYVLQPSHAVETRRGQLAIPYALAF